MGGPVRSCVLRGRGKDGGEEEMLFRGGGERALTDRGMHGAGIRGGAIGCGPIRLFEHRTIQKDHVREEEGRDRRRAVAVTLEERDNDFDFLALLRGDGLGSVHGGPLVRSNGPDCLDVDSLVPVNGPLLRDTSSRGSSMAGSFDDVRIILTVVCVRVLVPAGVELACSPHVSVQVCACVKMLSFSSSLSWHAPFPLRVSACLRASVRTCMRLCVRVRV